MKGRIGRRRRNRNIASVRGKGLGVYVIGDIAICDSDIALGETLRHDIGGDFATCDSDITSGDRIGDGEGRRLE